MTLIEIDNIHQSKNVKKHDGCSIIRFDAEVQETNGQKIERINNLDYCKNTSPKNPEPNKFWSIWKLEYDEHGNLFNNNLFDLQTTRVLNSYILSYLWDEHEIIYQYFHTFRKKDKNKTIQHKFKVWTGEQYILTLTYKGTYAEIYE